MQLRTNMQQRIQNFIDQDDEDEQIEINLVLQNVVGLSKNEIASINNLRGKGKQTICGAPIVQDSLFYRCFECCNEPGHVYCKACMSFEKHKGHIITYHYSNGGCCDCGDVLLNKDTWCDQHSVADDFSFPKIGEAIPIIVRQKVGEFMQTIIASIVERVESFIDLPCQFFHDSTLPRWEQIYKQLDNSLKRLSFEEISQIVTLESKKYEESIQMYNLLISVLESLCEQNVEMSRFIAEQFINPIDMNLQTYFQLRHIHSPGLQQQIFVGKSIQSCKCTLIQLFLKFHIFLDDDRSNSDRNQEEERLENFQTLFFSLHSHPQFKEALCQEFAENLLLLHKPVYRFTIGFRQYIYLNQISYSENSPLSFFFQFLNSEIEKNTIEKEYHVIMSSMYDYMYQLMGMLIQKIGSFKYQFELIDKYGQIMKNIPISTELGQQYWWKFESKIFTMFKSDQVINAYELLRRSLEEANQFIEFQSANIDPSRFSKLNRLLIIQFFFFAFPERALQLNKEDQENLDKCEFHILATTIVILQMHRSLLCSLINNAPNWVQRQTIKNILRMMISKAFQQVSAQQPQIQPQNTRFDFFKTAFGCFYVFDRWLTQILASYYSLISNISGEEFLKDLCFICNKSAADLEEIFTLILKRIVYQQLYFTTSHCRPLYQGQRKIYQTSHKFFEAPLSSFDCQFVQLYCFMFGQKGVCQLINLIQSFSVVRPLESTDQFLMQTINRLAQSDFELVHLVGSFFIVPYPGFLLKGITKTCATVFCGAQFYSFSQLEEIFVEAYGIEPALNLKSVVLSCCELNNDLQKIQLKPQNKASNNTLVYPGVKLHQYISERLLAQKQKLEFYFGTQLSEELRFYAEGRDSTLSSIRVELLQSIAKNSASIYSSVFDKLAAFYQANDFKKFLFALEENAAHLNVLELLIRYFNKTMLPRFFHLIESIKQLKQQQVQNLSDSQLDLLGVFLERFSPEAAAQNENGIVQKSDVKKRELQQRYKKQQFEFAQKLQETQVLNETTTQQNCCQVCSLPFEPDDHQQSLFIIQSVCNNNCVSYGPSQEEDSLKLHLSGCGHEVHLKCLNLNHKVKPLFGGKFGECPLCLQPYNFVLSDLEQMKVNEDLLTKSFQDYFKWMGQKESYYLKSKFWGRDQPEQKIGLIVFDLTVKLIASVINQLVNNCRSFSDQKCFQILGFLLSHSNNLMSSIGLTEQLKKQVDTNNEQHAFIVLAQKIKGQEYNQDILKQLITEFTMMSQTLSNFNNMDDLISSYEAYFPPNIREFYLKFGLQHCVKCNGFPLVRQKGQKQNQFICLLCKQKLCGYNCGENEEVDIGNLNFHAQFEHCGRAIYLRLPDAKVMILASPYSYFENTALYQSELGEHFVLANTLECRQQMVDFKFNKLLLVKLLKMIREETIMSYVFSKRQETYQHLEL